MLLKFNGLINPKREEVIEFLGDRYIEDDTLDEFSVRYKDNDGTEYILHFENHCKEVDDLLVYSLSDGFVTYLAIQKDIFKIMDLDESEPTNESEPVKSHSCDNCTCGDKSEEPIQINSVNTTGVDKDIVYRLLDIIEINAKKEV